MALIVAEIKDMPIYLWHRKNIDENEIHLIKCYHGSHFIDVSKCGHLLYTGSSTHFSLVSIPVSRPSHNNVLEHIPSNSLSL